MKRLGWYKELVDDDDPSRTTGSIKDVIGKGQHTVCVKVADYLASGELLLPVMGKDPDILDGEKHGLTSSLVSDGDWIWREDLSHYVRKYDLALPTEFLDLARSRQYRAPGLPLAELEGAEREAARIFQGLE